MNRYYITKNRGDFINTKEAFDRIENTLSEQGLILGRDYKIEHCNIQDFLIKFCPKKPNREIDIRELFMGFGGLKILKFKLSVFYPKHSMAIKLKLPITEEIK